jgi:hypothetical protein
MYAEHHNDYPNEAVLMDVSHVMLLISFDAYAETDRGAPDIMHLESIHHLIPDLPNQGRISNYEKIIEIKNDRGNGHAIILIMQHKQYSVDT